MKKIFAIALALVMVLSMTSAFATYCDGWSWACPTTTINCNKATIEVVPFVRSTNACGTGFDFTNGSCAAAVPNENIYFGVKLTVPSDMSESWWNETKLTIKATNVVAANDTITALNGCSVPTMVLAGSTLKNMTYDNVKKGGTYWLTVSDAAGNVTNRNDATVLGTANIGYVFQKEDADFTFGNKNVFSAKAQSTSAKVCATLASEWNTTSPITIGAYTFVVENLGNANQKITVYTNYKDWDDFGEAIVFTFNSDLKVATATYWKNNNVKGHNVQGATMVGYNADASAFKDAQGNVYGYTCNDGAFLKKVFDFMGISFDTCMTKDAIKKNIGWDDEVKSCTNYSKTGTAVVNPECQVAIPKTGDVSVVAYAVMALVAAAGAMGLKK